MCDLPEIGEFGSDCLTGDLPCQPFTKQRNRNGSTCKTSSVADHPSTQLVFSDFKRILECRRPKGFIIEEVPVFLEPNKMTGLSWCEQFVAVCSEKGYGVRVVRLSAGIWSEMPRERLCGNSLTFFLATPLLHIPKTQVVALYQLPVS